MRDDLHKRAPLARPWLKLVKACQRDADCHTAGRRAAVQALASELRENFSDPFLRALQEPVRHRQGKLFLQDDLQSCASPIAASPLERRTLEFAEVLIAEGTPPQQVPRRAVELALRSQVTAHFRELDGHLAMDAPADRREMLRRCHEAVAQSGLTGLIDSRLASRPLAAEIPNRKPIDIDEDLRRTS